MRTHHLALAVAVSLPLAGCELIGDIFQAGVWTGVVLVLAILAGIGFLVARFFKK